MPAVTVLDNLTLPRISTVGPGAQIRRVKSITDGWTPATKTSKPTRPFSSRHPTAVRWCG
jgi:hypothetical protein